MKLYSKKYFQHIEQILSNDQFNYLLHHPKLAGHIVRFFYFIIKKLKQLSFDK